MCQVNTGFEGRSLLLILTLLGWAWAPAIAACWSRQIARHHSTAADIVQDVQVVKNKAFN